MPAAFFSGVNHTPKKSTLNLTYAGIFASIRNAFTPIGFVFDDSQIQPVVRVPTPAGEPGRLHRPAVLMPRRTIWRRHGKGRGATAVAGPAPETHAGKRVGRGRP